MLTELPQYKKAYLVKCSNCKFIFSFKKPGKDELSKHYDNYSRYTDLPPLTKKRYFELLDSFEKYRKTNNLIDLGCSSGLFLQCAKERGWNVYGTEVTEECIEYCKSKKITVFRPGQLPAELIAAGFDIVTSFEVIEHLNQPHEEIHFVDSILRKGGAFYITTPNFNSLSRLYLKEKWNIIEYPEHLSYYTPATIDFLLKKHGFIKQYITTTGISITRFNQSTGAATKNADTKVNEDEVLRTRLENNPLLFQLKKAANFLLTLFKAGDAMKCFYIKP